MKGILIPQTIFVGDTAQFLFPLSEQDVYNFNRSGINQDTPIPLHNKIENEMMTVKEIRFLIKDTRPYLMITFVPWETGTIYFPSFSFLPLQRELPAVTVASLIDNTAAIALEPPKQPPLIPGTDYALYMALGIVVLSTSLLITGTFFVHRMLKNSHARYYAGKRMRLLKKTAKKLQKRLQKNKKKQSASAAVVNSTEIALWYTEIDHMIRSYLFFLYKDGLSFLTLKDEQLKRLFFSYTYEEIIDIIKTSFTAQPDILHSFTALYTALEKNRFSCSAYGSSNAHSEEIEFLLAEILSLAENIETFVSTLRTAPQGAVNV